MIFFLQMFVPLISAAEDVVKKGSFWRSCFFIFAVNSCRIPQEHQCHNNAQESYVYHVIHDSCDLNRKNKT